MSENNNSIYEITQLMKNPENINQDIATAFSLIGQHFHNKYINPIKNAVENHLEICSHNPGDEIILLQACKPFISGDANNIINKIIELMSTMETLQNISSEFRTNLVSTAQTEDSAIHSDGVYEMDSNCLNTANINTKAVDNNFLFIALAFILLFTKK